MDLTAKIKSYGKKTDKSGNPYWLVYLESGDVVSTWQYNLIAETEAGKEYTFPVEVTESGDRKYINLIGTAVAVISEEPIKPHYSPKSTKSMDNNPYIARMSAIKSAVEYYSGNPQMDEEDIIEIAKRFEHYIESGE